MYTVTAHVHRNHLPNRVTTRPVCVNMAREGSMGARNHPMGHADARVRCGGDFRLARGQPAARLVHALAAAAQNAAQADCALCT